MPIAALPPMQATSPTATVNVNDSLAKDAIIAWFRGEFAAANAIIDALCSHLSHLGDGYEGVFVAVHRRRMNWIPVLQMQKYYPISDVAVELAKVVSAMEGLGTGGDVNDDDLPGMKEDEEDDKEEVMTMVVADEETAKAVAVATTATKEEEEEEDDSPNSDITDSGN